MVSSLSPHNTHLLFCCILSILALTWLVLMVLFCAVIRRDSVSLLRFPFFSYIQVFLCEMLLICSLKCLYSHLSSHFGFLVIFVMLIPIYVSIVSDGSNQSSSALSYVFFKLFYRCINTIFNAGKSSSSFFAWQHIVYCPVEYTDCTSAEG